MAEPTKGDFVKKIADYVETHVKYDELTKRQAVESALYVLLNDIGAANDFLRVIGVDIDLYEKET